MGFFGKTGATPPIVNNYYTGPEPKKAEEKKEASKGYFDDYIDPEMQKKIKKYFVAAGALYAAYYVSSSIYACGLRSAIWKAKNIGLNTSRLEKEMGSSFFIEDKISEAYDRVEYSGLKLITLSTVLNGALNFGIKKFG